MTFEKDTMILSPHFNGFVAEEDSLCTNVPHKPWVVQGSQIFPTPSRPSGYDFGSTEVVLDILDAAEAILDRECAQEENIMEPSPLAPGGIHNIVNRMPLAESALLQSTDKSHRESLFVALQPLISKQCQEENMDAEETDLLAFSPIDDWVRCAFDDSVSQNNSDCLKKRIRCCPSSILPATKKRRCSKSSDQDFGTNQLILETEDSLLGSNHREEKQRSDCERFRSYQADQWNDRFQDLIDFRNKHGHCLVPHTFQENKKLVQWIKRQRYQYKLKQLGRHSTLTAERQATLEDMGFVWDSHKAAWIERFESLKEFKAKHGHCSVPSNYIDRSLAVWVKCQRRQYKLFQMGSPSTMSEERISQLEFLDFNWNPRKLCIKDASS